jgi:Phospholipase_D-nuclease N-terminal
MYFALLGGGALELLGLLFWLWMIYECATRERGTERVLWLLLVVCVPDMGGLIYFLVRVAKIRG